MRPLPGISRQRDFQRLFRQGRRYRGRFLTLVALPGGSGDPLRAAPICGKKIGSAVVRNQVKRRFREILRQAPWLEVAAGDLAVIAHPPAAQACYRDLQRELLLALRRAHFTHEGA